MLLQEDCSPMFLEPTTLEKLWNGLVLPLQPGPYQPSPLPFSLFAALVHVLITITGIKLFLAICCYFLLECSLQNAREDQSQDLG